MEITKHKDQWTQKHYLTKSVDCSQHAAQKETYGLKYMYQKTRKTGNKLSKFSNKNVIAQSKNQTRLTK